MSVREGERKEREVVVVVPIEQEHYCLPVWSLLGSALLCLDEP